jgi:hypothetical protein
MTWVLWAAQAVVLALWAGLVLRVLTGPRTMGDWWRDPAARAERRQLGQATLAVLVLAGLTVLHLL